MKIKTILAIIVPLFALAISAQAQIVRIGCLGYIPGYADTNLSTMSMTQEDTILLMAQFPYGRNTGGLKIVGISNFNEPNVLAFCPLSDSLIVNTYEEGIRKWDVKMQANYAYVGASDSGLIIIDLSIPTSPYVVGKLVGSIINRVTLDYPYIYAGTPHGLDIIDVSIPTSPRLISHLTPFGRAPEPLKPYVYDYTTGIEKIADQKLLVTSCMYAYLVDISDVMSPEITMCKGFSNMGYTGFSSSIHRLNSTKFVVNFSSGLGIIELATEDSFFLYWEYASFFSGQAATHYHDSILVILDGTTGNIGGLFIPRDSAEYYDYAWHYLLDDYNPREVIPLEINFGLFNVQKHNETDSIFFVSAGKGGGLIMFISSNPDTTAISDQQEKPPQDKIQIFPNPTDQFFTLICPSNRLVRIFDLSGKLVKIFTSPTPNYQINVSDLNSGIYLVEIITDNQKFIKKLTIVR
ncbi:MAG: T9SS type A sorting domain-containing protein [Patescibacteria group bacterium]|nr:T9SS type A sorting domain-containing protein [Patescibacteria group bacterium]